MSAALCPALESRLSQIHSGEPIRFGDWRTARVGHEDEFPPSGRCRASQETSPAREAGRQRAVDDWGAASPAGVSASAFIRSSGRSAPPTANFDDRGRLGGEELASFGRVYSWCEFRQRPRGLPSRILFGAYLGTRLLTLAPAPCSIPQWWDKASRSGPLRRSLLGGKSQCLG